MDTINNIGKSHTVIIIAHRVSCHLPRNYAIIHNMIGSMSAVCDYGRKNLTHP